MNDGIIQDKAVTFCPSTYVISVIEKYNNNNNFKDIHVMLHMDENSSV